MCHLLMSAPSCKNIKCDGRVVYDCKLQQNRLQPQPIFIAPENHCILAIDFCGNLLACALTNKQILLYDTQKQQQLFMVESHRKQAFLLFQNENSVLCLERDGTLCKINSQSQQLEQTLFGRSVTLSCALQRDGFIFIADRDGIIAKLNQSFMIEDFVVGEFGYISQLLTYQSKLLVVCENGIWFNGQFLVESSSIFDVQVADDKLIYVREQNIESFDMQTKKVEIIRENVSKTQYFKGLRMDVQQLRLVDIAGILALQIIADSNLLFLDQDITSDLVLSEVQPEDVNNILPMLKHGVGGLSNIMK